MKPRCVGCGRELFAHERHYELVALPRAPWEDRILTLSVWCLRCFEAPTGANLHHDYRCPTCTSS